MQTLHPTKDAVAASFFKRLHIALTLKNWPDHAFDIILQDTDLEPEFRTIVAHVLEAMEMKEHPVFKFNNASLAATVIFSQEVVESGIFTPYATALFNSSMTSPNADTLKEILPQLLELYRFEQTL